MTMSESSQRSSFGASGQAAYRIGLIPGDGIGNEVIPAAAARVLEAVWARNCTFEWLRAGWGAFERTGHGAS